jgi:hypothetical protein
MPTSKNEVRDYAFTLLEKTTLPTVAFVVFFFFKEEVIFTDTSYCEMQDNKEN